MRTMMTVVVACALAGAGCKRGGASKAAQQDDPPVPVQVLRLAPASITRALHYDADIRAELSVQVFSQVPERIVSLRFEEGDQVKQGQVLAVIRPDTLKEGERSATAALDAARADRDYLQGEIARQEKLLSKKIVSQAAVDQLRARLESATAQIRRLEAVASQASTARGNAIIRAPISGIIGRRFLSQGDMAAPGLPLCTVVRMDRVELQVDVPEQDLAHIRTGMVAEVTVKRFPQRIFRGQVTRISPTVDLTTRTARIEVVLDNEQHELMPGTLARVRLQVERRDDVVVLPYTGLIMEMGPRGDTLHRVYVLTGDRVTGREVTLGIVDEALVEVVSGLSFGETVVTRGQHALRDGRQVQVVERLTAAGEVLPVEEQAVPAEKKPGEPDPGGATRIGEPGATGRQG